MKYSIVIFPSKNLQDVANSYRKRYDSHYSLIPPHITLKQPFEETEIDIQAISEKLSHLAKDFHPFPIKVTKFSSFKPVNNIIYMKIEPRQELIQLHEALNKLFIQHPNEHNFTPHITVGRDLSDDEYSDVFSQLRLQSINHEETVDRFHLLYQLENGSWTVFETFRLGKE